MQSRRFATVVTIVIVLAFFLVAIAPAFATTAPGALPLHARLVSSAPAHKASVESVDQVVLTFNEAVNPDFVDVRVAGPDGGEVDGIPTVDGSTVTQPLTAPLATGEHTVTYRVVSADGHPVSGTLTFTTTTPGAVPSSTLGSTGTSPTEASPTASGAPTPAVSVTSEPAVDEAGTPAWLAIGITLGFVALATTASAAWLRRRRDRSRHIA